MSYYEYIKGKLVKQEDPLGFNNDEEWSACLRRNGFRDYPIIEYGVDEFATITMSVYVKDLFHDEWLVEICISSSCYNVSIKGLEGFLSFMKEYRTLFLSFCELGS